MKTEKAIPVGDLRLVLRNDGSIYLGRMTSDGLIMDPSDTMRLGGGPAICTALADALGEMAEHVRQRKAVG